jgi:hypothetical protein
MEVIAYRDKKVVRVSCAFFSCHGEGSDSRTRRPARSGFVSEDIFKVLLPSLTGSSHQLPTPLLSKMTRDYMHCIAVRFQLGCSLALHEPAGPWQAVPETAAATRV